MDGPGGEDSSEYEGLFIDSPLVYVNTPSECRSDHSDPLESLLAPSPEAETGAGGDRMASESDEDPFFLDKLLASPTPEPETGASAMRASESEKESLDSATLWASPDGETDARSDRMAFESDEDPFFLDKLLASPTPEPETGAGCQASESEQESLDSATLLASPDGETNARIVFDIADLTKLSSSQENSPSQEAASDPSDSDPSEMDMIVDEMEERVAGKEDQQMPLPLSAIPGLFDDFDPRLFDAETCDATDFSQGTSHVQPTLTSAQRQRGKPSKAPHVSGPKGPKSKAALKPSKAPHLL